MKKQTIKKTTQDKSGAEGLKLEAIRRAKYLSRCLRASYFKSEDFLNISKNLISFIETEEYQRDTSVDLYALDIYLNRINRAVTKVILSINGLKEEAGIN